MCHDEQLWCMCQTTAFDPKQTYTTDGYQVGDLRRHSGLFAAETESQSVAIQNASFSSALNKGGRGVRRPVDGL